MRGAVLAVAVAALAGCGEPPSVVVYWDFLRHTLTDQGDVVYDADVNVGGGDAACDEAGVDTITITDEAGNVVHPELPNIPCVFAGVQGVVVEDVRRGGKNWTVTGYRGDVPTYLGTTAFEARRDRETEISVTLGGIPDDLDIFTPFVDPRGTQEIATTCAAAGVETLGYVLSDFVGTVVAAGSVLCGDPAGISFRVNEGTGVDRDVYTLRMKAFPPNSADPAFDTAPAQLLPACQLPLFDHTGTDTGVNGFEVPLYDIRQGPRCAD
jgi:hypothetical protein